MAYSKKDIDLKLQEHPSLTRVKRQLEFELEMLSDSETGAVNQEYRNELSKLLAPITAEVKRMEFYIELLAENDGAALRALYMDGMKLSEAAAQLMVDEKTLVTRKNRGLTELAAMYNRLPKS